MSVNKVSQADGSLAPIAGGTLYADEPIGTILPFGGSAIPNGFLLCNGAAVNRTTYSALFAVIGTSFGSGDGSTTFNIPDLRGEFLRGAGTNSHSGQGDGGTVGQHQNATIIPNSGFATNSNNIRVYGYTSTNTVTTLATNFDKVLYASTTGVETTTSSNLNRFAATNDVASGTVRPTNTSVNYIIKATSLALPTDFADAVDDKIADNIVDSIADGNMKAVTSNAVYDAILSKISTLGASYSDSKTGLSFTAGVDQSITHSIANVPAGKYLVFYRIWNGESSQFSFYDYTDGCGFWQGTWSGTECKSVGKIASHAGGTFTRASVWRQMLNNNVGQVGITMQIVKIGIV